MAAVDLDALRGRATRALSGFSPSQLVIIGLLTVVAVVGGMSFLRWVSAPSYAVLMAGLEPEDAAAVTAALDESGVPYQLEGGGSTVLVPQDVVQAQRLAVAAKGLPAGSTKNGWAAFDQQGLTSSSFQQQVAYQRALEATLAGSVGEIDGIRSAQVHLALPEKRLFTDDAEAARASVLVDTGGTLPTDTVDAITHLVASSVPGLAPRDVSVTDSTGRLLTGDGASSGDRALKERQVFEDSLSARVDTMLATLLGPGQAVVRISAEVDRSDRTIDSETYDPTKSAVLSSSESTETYGEDPDPTAGGTVAQPTTAPAASASPSAGTGYSKKQTSVVNGVTRTVEREIVAPGGVKRLTVAVAVNRNAKNAPSNEEITSLVSAAVGLDTARGDSIAVTAASFPVADETATEAAAAGTGGGVVSTAKDAAPPVLAGLLLLLVAVGLLRAARGGTTEVSGDQLTAALAGARGQALAGPGHALPAGAVPAPRAEPDLLTTIDESTDEVAGLLRGWLAIPGGDR